MSVSSAAWRFALVGVSATAIHVVIAAGLIEVERVHPGVANGVAFVVANLSSYLTNTLWSFEAPIRLANWGRYIAVSVSVWSLTVAVAWLVEVTGGHYLVGIALVVLLVPPLSFLAHREFTYRL